MNVPSAGRLWACNRSTPLTPVSSTVSHTSDQPVDSFVPSQPEAPPWPPRGVPSVKPDATLVAQPGPREKSILQDLGGRLLDVQSKLVSLFSKMRSLAKDHPRVDVFMKLVSGLIGGCNDVAGLARQFDLSGAIKAMGKLSKSLGEGLKTLHESGLFKLSPKLFSRLQRCVPGLGAIVSGQDALKDLAKMTEAGRERRQTASLAYAIKFVIDSVSGSLSAATAACIASGFTAPLSVGMEVGVITLQVGSMIFAEIADPAS